MVAMIAERDLHEARLSNQTVLVLGGTSGIGLATAERCLRAGAAVMTVGRDRARLSAALSQLERHGPVRGKSIDVSDETQVEALFADNDPFDHVVVTAAAPHYGEVKALDLALARDSIDSKVFAALCVAKHAKIKVHGSLVLTAGIASDRPTPGGAVVAAANGALVSLTRALALELAPIRVNAVAPGWTDTPVWDQIAGPDKYERQAEQASKLPTGRIGTAHDIADAIVFLLGNGFTTAETLHVDGGHRYV